MNLFYRKVALIEISLNVHRYQICRRCFQHTLWFKATHSRYPKLTI